VNQQARGTFEVNLKPAVEPDASEGVTLGRMSIDKTFHGNMTGTGRGEMLSAMTSVEGSAGYVAIERVRCTRHGCKGSFIFQHTGIMNRGEQQLSIIVVPDSGTGELVGIAGCCRIDMVNGEHHYVFDYALPE
jgi:hypothetical protein